MTQKFTILFDLDGTLVNTAPDLMNAHNHVMKKYGFKEKNLSDIKKLAGRGSKVMLTRSLSSVANSNEFEDKIDKLVIVDIANRNYRSNKFSHIFDAISSLNLSNIKSRIEADELIKSCIPNLEERNFLLKRL